MAGLDVVAMTSFNEGTPVSLIEAQAANKAIVSTAVGGIEDVVQSGKTALLSASNDPGKFASNLLYLIETEGLLDTFGKDGFEFVNRQFGFHRLATDMSKFYDSLVK